MTPESQAARLGAALLAAMRRNLIHLSGDAIRDLEEVHSRVSGRSVTFAGIGDGTRRLLAQLVFKTAEEASIALILTKGDDGSAPRAVRLERTAHRQPAAARPPSSHHDSGGTGPRCHEAHQSPLGRPTPRVLPRHWLRRSAGRLTAPRAERSGEHRASPLLHPERLLRKRLPLQRAVLIPLSFHENSNCAVISLNR